MRRLLAALLLAGAFLAPASAALAQTPGCDVASASLTWGFKESFRAYIDGSIANGEWTVADGATYDTPSFGFPGGSGLITGLPLAGQIDFPGSVRFTGHGGILDTTIANPVLVFRESGDALLLLDVSGPTMAGDQVSVTATPFVSIDLSGQDLAPVDGVVTITDAPTTLTADGETAFPNYPAGETFDPVTVTLPVGDCALAAAPGAADPDTVRPGEPRNTATVVILTVVVSATSIAGIVGLFLLRRARRRA